MYPAPFAYARAGSWTEAVQLLGQHGEDAKVIAGGQSLVPMMSLRLAKPSHLVDVGWAGDRDIRVNGGGLEISALARHSDILGSLAVRSACRLLSEAAGHIGNVRVRHRGTIGGSLAHADPAAEYPCVAVATGAVVRTLGGKGERRHPAGDFFVTYLTTLLEPDEVVVAVEIPPLGERAGSAFLEHAYRAGDFAVVEVAAVVRLDDGNACTDVRLVVGGVADRPVDLSARALEVLAGARIDDSSADRAARAVADAADPRDDDKASASYRRRVIRALTSRVVTSAGRRARGEEAA
jgi:carbon-monoxide dehydrogenase medium subunit